MKNKKTDQKVPQSNKKDSLVTKAPEEEDMEEAVSSEEFVLFQHEEGVPQKKSEEVQQPSILEILEETRLLH